MSHLNKIFAVWDDNAEAMASDIGETGVNVRAWRNRGNIHSDHWPKIIKAAARRGAELHPEDFWPPEVVAELPRHCGPSAGGRPAEDLTTDGDPQEVGRGPFLDSPSTCSTTPASTASSTNPASSTGEDEARAA